MAKRTPVRETRRLAFPKGMLAPKDWLRFIQLSHFERSWVKWKLSDDDLKALEMLILIYPDGHPVIEGTGGVRKLRFSSDAWPHGKSKGARVYYLYIPEKGVVILLFAHMRDEEDYLSVEGKSTIKKLVSEVVGLFENG